MVNGLPALPVAIGSAVGWDSRSQTAASPSKTKYTGVSFEKAFGEIDALGVYLAHCVIQSKGVIANVHYPVVRSVPDKGLKLG